MSILELRGVHRTHGTGEFAVHALAGINLTVSPGELIAIMGPSGSGKSTLLNLAGGLDRPTSGDVVVEGQILGDLNRRQLAGVRRRSIGYVFQDLNLLPSLTAGENVALPLELDGASVRAARKAAIAALTEVGLEDLLNRFPDDMSGGQQQRVAIARALVGNGGSCSPTNRPARSIRSPESPCCGCCGHASTRGRPAFSSRMRRVTPAGPTGSCS